MPGENRTVIFIDGRNLYSCVKQDFSRTDIDIEKLTHKLVGHRTLVKAYRYDLPLSPGESSTAAEAQQGLSNIALDLVAQAVGDIYDTAVLVSGNSDLVEAVRSVQDQAHKQVENAFTKSGWAPDLREICNMKTLLDEEFLRDCWMPPK